MGYFQRILLMNRAYAYIYNVRARARIYIELSDAKNSAITN